jgi:hypothetical protein
MVGTPGSPTAPPRVFTVDIFSIDGGRSQISDNTSQGDHHRCFLALIVGAPGSPTSPPMGPAVDVFLALMVGAPGSLAPLPRGLAVDVFYVDGGNSWISDSTS